MPANSKYLTRSKWQRFAKISAGFIGGFMASVAIHIALASWINRPLVIITSSFTSFLLWSVFFVLAFIPQNGWKTWGIYLLIILFCGAITYLSN